MNQSRSSVKPQPQAANDSTAFIDKIRPDSGVAEPVYKQLLRRIVQLIESGELGDGFSLPSERALAEALALSRTTVRRCYEELRAQDHIDTHGRAGATVKAAPQRIAPEMGRLKGFTEEMRELGMVASTRILEQGIVEDRTIASIFNRPASNRFFRIVRLRLGDGNPMSREVAWYDLTPAPDFAQWNGDGSAYQFLQERCGLSLQRADQTIEAVICNQAEMRVFGFEQPGPCLLLKRKTYTDQGTMVEYVEGTFRGDAYTYRVELKMPG
ncbi:GntR family transcriptional regulator [Methylomonas sp. HW2-6]|uniref:GntR family transcriptional regulator n=1 Tax=Methylomonas sp. HW2-6 TaxID=3376687 RepID=UPI0040421650